MGVLGLVRRGAPAAAIGVVAVTACVLLGLARCDGPSRSAAAGATEVGAEGTVVVVASTDVWADVARSVGGDAVSVTAITGSGRDLRTFEATPADQRLVRSADLVIVNGGGYDDVVAELVLASGARAPVVEALAVSGLHSTLGEHEHEHEHGAGAGAGAGAAADDDDDDASDHQYVWYDLSAAGKVAEAVAEALAQLDPDRAVTYLANAQALVEGLVPLRQLASDVATRTRGVGVAVTDPVANHLLELMGLTVTAPAVLAEAEAQLADGTVTVLVDDVQQVGAEVAAVRAAAGAAGVPVVEVTQGLPQGLRYTQWMTANIAAISAAVGARSPAT